MATTRYQGRANMAPPPAPAAARGGTSATVRPSAGTRQTIQPGGRATVGTGMKVPPFQPFPSKVGAGGPGLRRLPPVTAPSGVGKGGPGVRRLPPVAAPTAPRGGTAATVKPSVGRARPNAQAIAHANANASFKRTAAAKPKPKPKAKAKVTPATPKRPTTGELRQQATTRQHPRNVREGVSARYLAYSPAKRKAARAATAKAWRASHSKKNALNAKKMDRG